MKCIVFSVVFCVFLAGVSGTSFAQGCRTNAFTRGCGTSTAQINALMQDNARLTSFISGTQAYIGQVEAVLGTEMAKPAPDYQKIESLEQTISNQQNKITLSQEQLSENKLMAQNLQLACGRF